MNSLDVILLAILAICVIHGLVRGLIMEIFSLLAVVIAFVAANLGYPVVAEHIRASFGIAVVDKMLAYMLLFTLVSTGVGFIGLLVRKLFKAVKLSWLDRLGGAGLGLLKGGLICLVMVAVSTAFLPASSRALSESQVAPPLMFAAAQLLKIMPDPIRKAFDEKCEQLRRMGSDFERRLPLQAPGAETISKSQTPSDPSPTPR